MPCLVIKGHGMKLVGGGQNRDLGALLCWKPRGFVLAVGRRAKSGVWEEAKSVEFHTSVPVSVSGSW